GERAEYALDNQPARKPSHYLVLGQAEQKGVVVEHALRMVVRDVDSVIEAARRGYHDEYIVRRAQRAYVHAVIMYVRHLVYGIVYAEVYGVAPLYAENRGNVGAIIGSADEAFAVYLVFREDDVEY